MNIPKKISPSKDLAIAAGGETQGAIFAARLTEAKKAQDYPEADRIWNQALRSYPDDAGFWFSLGEKLGGEDRKTVDALRIAYHLDPDNVVYATALAARIKKQDPQTAEALLLRQLQNPENLENAGLFYCLAKTYGYAGNYDLAVTCMDRAIYLDPDNQKYARVLEEFEGKGGKPGKESAAIIARRRDIILSQRAAGTIPAPGPV